MKNLQHWALLCGMSFIIACGPGAEQPVTENYYGNVIDSIGVQSPYQVKAALATAGSTQAKLGGRIIETCSKKGCWMRVAVQEDTVMVMFKDYGFFVPTGGVDGKLTYMEGKAYFDTITIEQRQHFAEDAGKGLEEITAITEPEYTLAFEAEGVIIVQ